MTGGVERPGNPSGSVSTSSPDEEQRSDGISHEGTFAFRQDAMKDVNQRVRQIAVPRRTIFLDSAWETTIGEPCWSCSTCGPMRYYISPVDASATWTDQAIWDRLWDNIQDATEEVVGEQGLLSHDQISQDLKESLDDITDVGEYRGERSGEAGYYDFILEHIAVRTIGDGSGRENMVNRLSEENGWLQHKFQERTLRDIHRNTHVNQEELFLATNLSQPRYNWRVNRTYDRERQRVLNESFHVDFSHYLSEDNGLSIEIDYPESGQHFVDVQGRYSDDTELQTDMSWSSFQTAIEVSIEGSLEVNTTTDRRNTPVGVHKPSWYNGTLHLDYHFDLPLHSAQPLESGWRTNDVDYQMTRSYFELMDDETIQSDRPIKEDGIYISRPLMDLTRAMTDVHSRSTNTLNSLRGHLRGYPHSALSEGTRTSSDMTPMLSTLDDIYSQTYEDSDYFNFIDEQKDLIGRESEQKSEFEYPSMGYIVNYDVDDDPLNPVYECNRTVISFELGEQQFSYEAERSGSVDLNVEVDPSQEERIVVEAEFKTMHEDFSIDMSYPPESLSSHEISLYDVESRQFSNIHMPNLGDNYNVDVGIMTRDDVLPQEVEQWIEDAAEGKENSYDGLVRFSKDLMKEMHEDPDVFEESDVDEIGLYFHVEQDFEDPDTKQRFIYWTNRTSSGDIIRYSRLLINDMRSVGRTLGAGSPAHSLFRKVDEDMMNDYSFEIIGAEGNYTRGNLAWWASAEPSIGDGRKADYFVAELGRTALDEEEKYEVQEYGVYGTVVTEIES